MSKKTVEKRFTIVVGADRYEDLYDDVMVDATEEQVIDLLTERGQLTDEITKSIQKMDKPQQSFFDDYPALIFIQLNGIK